MEYRISISGAPYGQSPHAQYRGELYRTGIRSINRARRIARDAVVSHQQVAHIYAIPPHHYDIPGDTRPWEEVDAVQG